MMKHVHMKCRVSQQKQLKDFSYNSQQLHEVLTVHFAILLTKTTAVQNEDALSYIRVRGLFFLAVVFVSSIIPCISQAQIRLPDLYTGLRFYL